MPLDLGKFDVMEYLWDTLDKTPDGNSIRYTQQDVEQLWQLGFVDTEKYGLDEWMAVFEPYRQADGSFVLSRDEFLSLDRYRYTGEIRIPFDAMRINEGRYTDEGLDDLVEASIAPSCSLPPDKLEAFFDAIKKDFRDKDNLIEIRKPAKERIKALLDAHSSPLRNLELIFDHMIATSGEDLSREIEAADVEIATVEAARQVSSFSTQPASRSEAEARRLKGIEKAKEKKPHPAREKPTVELKKIKRSRKGTRG